MAAAADLQAKAAAGLLTPAKLHQFPVLLFNARLDAAVTGTFLLLVAAILFGSVRVWWKLLRGTAALGLKEEPLVWAQPE